MLFTWQKLVYHEIKFLLIEKIPLIERSHVAPCFSQLNLTNNIVPLTIPSVSCDAHSCATASHYSVMSHLISIFFT